MDFSVLLSHLPHRRTLAFALLLAGLALRASASSMLAPPINLDSRTTACQGLRVAAPGPENVVVAWASADPARGICYVQRLNYLWQPVRQLGAASGASPRDLAMTFDRAGRLVMVWTVQDGRHRRLMIARLDSHPGAAPPVPRLAPLPPPPDGEPGDADFPAISADPAGGVVIVWQESRRMRFTIRAIHLLLDGSLDDLGAVSGNSLSGLSPQVVSTNPSIQVAWSEITESGSQPRLNEWQPGERRWRPAAAERELARFPRGAQLLLTRADAGLLACWPAILGDGRGAIAVGLRPVVSVGAAPEPTVRELATPPGQHTRPSFSGSLPGRLTLAWQVLTGGNQAIRLASLMDDPTPPLMVTVSEPSQRFAAMPDHVTCGGWSAVVWTDDVHEGGTGGVYFSQLAWPNMP